MQVYMLYHLLKCQYKSLLWHLVNIDLYYRQQSVESSTERSGSLHRRTSMDKDTVPNSVTKPSGDKLIEAERAETGKVSWWSVSSC